MKFNLPRHMSNYDMLRCQDHLLEMAKAVTDLLKANQIQYFLGYGTLLGAVRLKNFFPWDDDFDICLLDNKYDVAINLLAEELPERLFVHCEKSDHFYFHSWARVLDTSVRVVPDVSASNIDNFMYSYPFLSMDIYKMTVLPSNDCRDFLLEENVRFWKRKLKRNMVTENQFNQVVDLANRKYNEKVPKKLVRRPHIMQEVKMRHPVTLDTIFPSKELIFGEHKFEGPRNPTPFLESAYGNFRRLPPLAKRKPHYVRAVFD